MPEKLGAGVPTGKTVVGRAVVGPSSDRSTGEGNSITNWQIATGNHAELVFRIARARWPIQWIRGLENGAVTIDLSSRCHWSKRSRWLLFVLSVVPMFISLQIRGCDISPLPRFLRVGPRLRTDHPLFELLGEPGLKRLGLLGVG